MFRDEAGRVVASAELQLPEPLKQSGKFQGKWRLLSSTNRFPSAATRSGGYSAEIHATDGSVGELSIDLNPGMADNNVILHGSLAQRTVSGRWYHATFTGAKAMGTFALTRQGASQSTTRSPGTLK